MEQLKSMVWELEHTSSIKDIPIIVACTMSDTWTDGLGKGGFSFKDVDSEIREKHPNAILIPVSVQSGENVDKLMDHLLTISNVQ